MSAESMGTYSVGCASRTTFRKRTMYVPDGMPRPRAVTLKAAVVCWQIPGRCCGAIDTVSAGMLPSTHADIWS